MPEQTSSQQGPLADVRVLDLTRVLAGPFCTMVLADLGAEVVKVERPEVGDDARGFGPFLPSGMSVYFASLNRGKRSITLDLKSDEGRKTFRRLAAVADVLVENFRPGTMAAMELGPEDLRTVNPRLVYASVSGFGQTGPRAARPAYDIIIQAMSGLMSITGSDAQHRTRVGASISDITAGLFTAIGILAELHCRERHEKTTPLDVSMLDCTVAVLENAISRFTSTGAVPEPLGTRHPSIAPFQAFPTADGQIVVAAGNDALWRKLCEALGEPQWADDPRFSSAAARHENRSYLEEVLSGPLARESSATWLSRLQAVGVPVAPVRDIAEVSADEDLAARGMLHTMVDRDGATFQTAGSPLGSRALSPSAPVLGEHNDEVLGRWLGEQR